jgi:exodeoxyribonuclease V alpha subunit
MTAIREDPLGPLDPFDPRLVRGASGLLREFNQAGVLSAADVHVARRLAALTDQSDEAVLLAIALAVRAPRLGHVHVDLSSIRETAAVDADDPVDLGALGWPAPEEWVDAVARSPLVAGEGGTADGDASGVSLPVRPLRLFGSWLYLDRYWTEEVAVASSLRSMLADRPAGVDARLLEDGLRRLFGNEAADRQAQAAALLCEQAAAADPSQPPLIALAAPTGKAAARLQEAVHGEATGLDVSDAVREQLLGLSASTLHRMLGWRPGSNSRFRHSRDQRLPHDVVIVDETSMVSLSLMAKLIEALRSDARLVLVGDPGQLASIEAGAVLGDIVGAGTGAEAGVGTGAEAGVGTGTGGDGIVVLDREHRFGGGIARVAAAIRRGDAEATMTLLRECLEDVVWIPTDAARAETAPLVRSSALTAAKAVIAAARDGDPAQALAALGTFRILCAHRRGPYGVTTWTTRMQDWLEAEVPGFSAQERWYVGRPLLVTENDYELGLNNGDAGVVVQAGENRVMASFERGGDPVAYSPSRIGAVETVYAMTIHKSQGSQFDAAAVILPDPDSRLLTRELLYTAATRARHRLILAGTAEAIIGAVNRPVARASGLGWRLWGDA